jgi:hypothetical protein
MARSIRVFFPKGSSILKVPARLENPAAKITPSIFMSIVYDPLKISLFFYYITARKGDKKYLFKSFGGMEYRSIGALGILSIGPLCLGFQNADQFFIFITPSIQYSITSRGA